jgi:hypothetical protein
MHTIHEAILIEMFGFIKTEFIHMMNIHMMKIDEIVHLRVMIDMFGMHLIELVIQNTHVHEL